MKYLERSYPWFLLAPALLPVVVWGGVIYPFLVPKTLLFYALSLITFGIFCILVTHGYALYWERMLRWESWIPGALLALAYVSSIYGIDLYRSFWSLFIRGDGLLMLTCAVSSFYLILLSADHTFFRRLLYAASAVGGVVALYGIGEWLLGGGRIGSLLGNAAFFAGYVGITIFATLAIAHTLPLFWKRAAYAGAILQVIAVVLTATRGTILALVLVGVIYLCYAAMTQTGKQRRWIVSALISVILVGVMFVVFHARLATVPFEPVARLASISLSDGTVSSRLFIWNNMLTEIRKSPLLGVGAEHIDTLFNRFYEPTQIYEQWFDRSHNAFLDYTAQYGVGGFMLYTALIISFFGSAFRLLYRDRRTGIMLILLAITYTVQNIFVFDTVSSFWLFLALVAVTIAAVDDTRQPTVLSFPTGTHALAWGVAIIGCYLVFPVSIQPLRAASDLAHAYVYQLTDVPKEVDLLSQGFARGTYADLEYGYQVYDMYVHRQSTFLTGDNLESAFQSALTILSTNFNRYPYDGRTALYLAQVLALSPEGISIDTALLSEALARAIETSPKRAQSWYLLANLSIGEANKHPERSKERAAGYAAATDIISKYIELVPGLAEPYFVRAQLKYAGGDTKAASQDAAKGKELYRGGLEVARRAVSYYGTVQDLPNLEFFLTEVVSEDLTAYAYAYDLAKVQFLLGHKDTATEIVAKLRADNPAILDTDPNFLNAINAYESR